jgi:hypothetical protein
MYVKSAPFDNNEVHIAKKFPDSNIVNDPERYTKNLKVTFFPVAKSSHPIV